MLTLIRKHAQKWFIKAVMWGVVGGFVGTIFLVWGRGREEFGGGNVAASVNGVPIFVQELEATYRNALEVYRQIYRGSFDREMEERLNLRGQILEELIDQQVALNKAKELGFSVSQGELAEAIASYPGFQEGGRFSQRRYVDVLTRNRMSPEEFEAGQRKQLLLRKVERLIKSSVVISDGEAWGYFQVFREKVGLKFLRLEPASLESRIPLAEKELAAYFEANKSRFQIPARIKVQYIFFPPADFSPEVKVTEEQIDAYYQEHKGEFQQVKKVRARHILIRVGPNDDASQVERLRQKALEVLERAKKGENFALLAQRYSQGPEAKYGGDLGFFAPGQMIKPIEEMAFSLKPGEISPLIKTDLGFSILKVEEAEEAGPRPLEKVRAEVEAKLRLLEARKLAEKAAETAYEAMIKGEEFNSVAKRSKAKLVTTPFFSQGEKISPIESESFYTAAFALTPGLFSPVVKSEQGYYLVRLVEKVQARTPKYEEVKDKVARDLRKEKAVTLAKEKAAGLLDRLKKGENISALAEKEGLKLERSGLFSRGDPAVPGLASAPELMEAAFALSEANPYAERPFTLDGAYYIIALDRRELPLRKEFEPLRDRLKEQFLTVKREEVWANWLANLRKEAKVTININLPPARPG